VQILLLSMPDSFEHTPTLAVRMPNGALASLAGNVDAHHRVAIADLILAQSSVQPTVTRLMRELKPELVGLSVMTFQRGTARRIISLVKSINPDAKVVVGGYDPSLAPEATPKIRSAGVLAKSSVSSTSAWRSWPPIPANIPSVSKASPST